MAVTPLTAAQQLTVDALVAGGRLTVVPVDLMRASLFVRHAQEAIVDLPNLTRVQNRYNLASDACHDLGEALLASHGYRTRSGPGQHEALGRFLRAVLDRPPGQREARRYEQLRRSRNQQRYDARPVGEAEAALAEETARGLLVAVGARGVPA